MTADGSALPNVDGQAVLYVGPGVPEDAPSLIAEGIVRRRLLVTTGACPCGAVFIPPNRAARRAAHHSGAVLHCTVRHDHDCPAASDELAAYLRRQLC